MGICICCCCNKKNTDYIENTLIVFNSIEILFLILGLILIEWEIASSLCLALNLIIFFLLFFSLAIVIIFKIFRDNELIYSKFRKLCTILAYVGMGFSIACVFLAIISESLISEKIYQYDHPCLYKYKDSMAKYVDHTNGARVDNDTLIKNFCESLDTEKSDVLSDIFWYNKRSAPKDIIMPYICSTIIEVFSLIGAFYWYNDVRRIKYCIKRKMIEERGLIKYGPLGGYVGTNVEKNKTYVIKNDRNRDEEILGIRDNNLYTNRIRNVNINYSTNSSNDANNMNRIDNIENDDIVNQQNNANNGPNNNNEQNEEVKREPSISSEIFY